MHPSRRAVLAALSSVAVTSPVALADYPNGPKKPWVNRSKYLHFLKGEGINRRPFSAAEKKVWIRDVRIDRIRNEKGINIGATVKPDGKTSWAYREIRVTHCELSNINMDPGIHADFVRIFGGPRQDTWTTVVLRDLYIHDGNALPLIIQDGQFDRVYLQHLRIERTHHSIQISTINAGHVKDVYVDHCPDIGITLMGRPGTIGRVHVRNSPGIYVFDANTKNGRSGVQVIHED
jgi:hypothetical protein